MGVIHLRKSACRFAPIMNTLGRGTPPPQRWGPGMIPIWRTGGSQSRVSLTRAAQPCSVPGRRVPPDGPSNRYVDVRLVTLAFQSLDHLLSVDHIGVNLEALPVVVDCPVDVAPFPVASCQAPPAVQRMGVDVHETLEHLDRLVYPTALRQIVRLHGQHHVGNRDFVAIVLRETGVVLLDLGKRGRPARRREFVTTEHER